MPRTPDDWAEEILPEIDDEDAWWVPDEDRIIGGFTVPTPGAPKKDGVEVYWTDGDVFDEYDYPFAHALALVGGDTILLNDVYRAVIGHRTLLHELSHSFGYRHGDGGVMNIKMDGEDAEDMDPDTPPAEPTRVPADNCAGFEVLDWSASALGTVVTAFGQGKLPASRLGYGVTKYASNGASDVLYTSSFNDFGGVKATDSAYGRLRMTVGYFYGLPTV